MPDSYFALEAVVRFDGQIVARCLLRRGRYVIGHDRKNEINAYHDSVSGKHARLTVTSNDEFAIEDLGSANGTFVNGSAIDGVTALTLDSTIQLGEVTLAFERGGLPASIFAYLPEGFLRTSRYAVGEPTVEGRTSIIYEALDTVLRRTVAMKVLRPEAQADAALVLAFIREAQIAAQLPHGGILPVYDFGADPEIGLFSATRFIEGESLANLLNEMASGNKDAPQATLYSLLQVFLKACSAVAFAHARGVVHGALRPEAIIFGSFGEVFVDHWGFASLIPPPGSEYPVVQAPERTAAPPLSRYTTPEQAEGAADIDARTDVHALGAILFRILTLRHFNPGETDEELLDHALQPRLALAEALTAYALGGPRPERLAAACARALNPAREERFANARELKKEISDWLESSGPSSEPTKIWKQLTGLLGRR